ncbi:hypothetical protein MKZ08_08360 [Viridibacillus sp. FSL R5-0477]|uniref:hypothetical protein n=1 Tax=Viridibacillus TaxID=496496 RepID=UPI0004B2BD20|nr:hypothetical protein [Viridibacillus arenosi]
MKYLNVKRIHEGIECLKAEIEHNSYPSPSKTAVSVRVSLLNQMIGYIEKLEREVEGK